MLKLTNMKLSTFTRTASFLLAFGFFFACSSSNESIDSLIEESKFDLALAQIDLKLEENPSQPFLWIKKGEINLAMASENQPIERSDFYYNSVVAFDGAMANGADSVEAQQITEFKTRYWSQEHNAGTALYNSSENSSDSTFSSIVASFTNAIILKSQEANSYLSLATAYYANGNIDDAIKTLSSGKNSLIDIPSKLYENLGFLYLQNGAPDQSVFYYELANKDIIESKNIAFGLVNAYISISNSEKAIVLLRELSEKYPTDSAIRNVFGTQLYVITEGILDDLIEAYNNNDSSLVTQILFEAEGVGEQAESELIQAYIQDKNSTEYLESLAVFYNNLTGRYLSISEIAFQKDTSMLLKKASTLVDFAIEYYEKLQAVTSQDPTIDSSLETLKKLKENRFNS